MVLPRTWKYLLLDDERETVDIQSVNIFSSPDLAVFLYNSLELYWSAASSIKGKWHLHWALPIV